MAHDPHLRYSAVGASAGAAIVGAGGAATGLTTGSLLGAAVGRSIWATLLVVLVDDSMGLLKVIGLVICCLMIPYGVTISYINI